MKLNRNKYHLLVLDYEDEQVWGNIVKHLIWESYVIKFLGIIIHGDLKFDKYVLELCSKANQKTKCSF